MHHPNRLFMGGIIVKGVQAAIEGICGVLLLFVATDTIKHVVQAVTQLEMAHHPDDFIAAYIFRLSQGFSLGSQHFYAFYFIAHALVKLFLVFALLKNKRWAYPVAMGALGFFVAIQCVRLATDWSWPLLGLVMLDIIVIGLIFREYRTVRCERLEARQASGL